MAKATSASAEGEMRRTPHFRWQSIVMVFLVLTATPWAADAQANKILGVNICSCSPTILTVEFNFSAGCSDDVATGTGVNATSCIVSGLNNPNATDLVPVSISSIAFLELDQNLQVIVDTSFINSFKDGETVKYTSLTAVGLNPTNITAVPRGLQVSIQGANAEGQQIINVWIITYSNDCGFYPVLTVGERIGWSIFVSCCLFAGICVDAICCSVLTQLVIIFDL
jgi:hypothetical protein